MQIKLSGEAWLQFKIINNTLYQDATFKPLGLIGKIYWYSVLPFNGLKLEFMGSFILCYY
ncbi:DUF2867 domain-containing protein [Flavobacterium sp. 245]|uniref:DUF2867 domain-containing protein n=1 Tax=Flavobacterium sp. 245 TaxID=2512115 RepID=UPI0039773570